MLVSKRARRSVVFPFFEQQIKQDNIRTVEKKH